MFRNNASTQFLRVGAIALLFGAAAVHAQSDTGTSSTATTSQPSAASGGNTYGTTSSAAKSGMVNRADQAMMRDLAYANIAEIEAGKLAQSKSQNDQVKSFAQKMVDDHTKALDDLKKLADAKNVTLPTKSDSKHQAMAKKLDKLSGAQFDRQYLAQGGMSDHKTTHNLLQRIQSRATDPDLKQLATQTIPVVNQHMDLAQQTQNAAASGGAANMSGVVGPTGGSTSGTPPTSSGSQGAKEMTTPGK